MGKNLNLSGVFENFKGKGLSFLLYCLGWSIFSLTAAYPSFMLYGDTTVFQTTTRDQFCEKFLTPVLLFLVIFIFELVFSIAETEIDKKKGELLKVVFILLAVFFFLFTAIIYTPLLEVKIGLFLFMWASIVMIKGITIVVPENEVIQVSKPVIN